MVEVGNVVTLKNGREYLILDEETYYEKDFVYTVRVDSEDEPLGEYEVFRVLRINGESYLFGIKEKMFHDALIAVFKDLIRDYYMAGEYDDLSEKHKKVIFDAIQ